MLFGAGAAVMIGMAGLTLDSALVYGVKDKLQRSVDAAALAAGRVPSPDQVIPEANQIFNANFDAGGPDATLLAPGLSVTVGHEGESVSLEAAARYTTKFLGLVGFDHFDVSANTTVQRVVRPTEVAVVLDVTGSMSGGNKIAAMRTAATSLVNLLFGDVTDHPQLFMSVVPYTSTVNVGTEHEDWLTGFDAGAYAEDPQGWKGCVEARANGGDVTDDPPSVQPFEPFLYENDIDNEYAPVHAEQHWKNNGTGPNLGCGPAIVPLTNNKQTVLDTIAGLMPWHRGGTTSNLGMVWGWRSISPRWQGLWDLADRPLPYNQDETRKAVVILTDGINQFWPNLTKSGGGQSPGGSDYTAYGRLADLGAATGGEVATLADGVEVLNNRFTEVCNALKANDVDVFTITFGLNSSSHATTKQIYQQCASKPDYYFDSPTTEQLELVFRTVGIKLSQLRIVE